MKEIAKSIEKIIGCENMLLNEPMSKHTTFKTGGNADFFLRPKDKEELKNLMFFLRSKNIPYFIMGNGSNVLVTDKGYRGAIIQIQSRFKNIALLEDNTVFAEAGAMVSSLSFFACERGLSGIEFASGIPGTFGGAIFMNAGAYGGEFKDVIISVDALDKDGNFKTIFKDELNFGYRKSVFTENTMVILGGMLKLNSGKTEDIKKCISDLSAQRILKQPLEYPSAGSTFKRPQGFFAGKLISDAGLKGFSIGGAQVSEKHAGFIINKSNAKSEDILNLIEYCRNKVYDMYGVLLEPEVKIVGEF